MECLDHIGGVAHTPFPFLSLYRRQIPLKGWSLRLCPTGTPMLPSMSYTMKTGTCQDRFQNL